MDSVLREALTEATIAWAVCASLHREYCKGRDPLFTQRQKDFVKHEADARAKLIALADAAPCAEPTEHGQQSSAMHEGNPGETLTLPRASPSDAQAAQPSVPMTPIDAEQIVKRHANGCNWDAWVIDAIIAAHAIGLAASSPPTAPSSTADALIEKCQRMAKEMHDAGWHATGVGLEQIAEQMVATDAAPCAEPTGDRYTQAELDAADVRATIRWLRIQTDPPQEVDHTDRKAIADLIERLQAELQEARDELGKLHNWYNECEQRYAQELKR